MVEAVAEAPQPRDVTVGPAVVQELAYALFRLAGTDSVSRNADIPWLRVLESTAPTWLQEARAIFGQPKWTAYEALLMACGLGYAFDAAPDRFLSDLPDLPARMLGELESLDLSNLGRYPTMSSRQDRLFERLRGNFEELATKPVTTTLENTLHELWSHLSEEWANTGQGTVQAAADAFLRKADQLGDVLEALPTHHVVSLETSISAIREKGDSVTIYVSPLYFAAMGGYSFQFADSVFLGYGVRSEQLFRRRQDEVRDLSAGFKALSDPTRLMLLILVSRLRRFPLTVGDLAKRLGVSQPTASGHLRMLRNVDLVEVVKRGNRSYYRLREESLTALLDDLDESLRIGQYRRQDDD